MLLCHQYSKLVYYIQQRAKTYNILVMGRAAFMRVPVSEANDLNYLLAFFEPQPVTMPVISSLIEISFSHISNAAVAT